ncbi:uncharacterized protein PGTG_17880 [Puccinia graminis f. sp. tritici CRL 75-36-700-3]|uniref:Uncharacterized protein n=1 Tax=Puccinia graminis f. sp. tritici (strain CRL 75-36-700-3 / race SCCL) TaxID=418459 RepID=E3L6H5_PUCGT|nr:uncharacterized protein PGTG_17880 [Puccinia graminis f. sp. tritici CRL 75-36-700-3]EFP92150.1 hypothetical protein PGTG_17880 [Puccinia graminis f. sp. tritici CRL 75-36-700-3]
MVKMYSELVFQRLGRKFFNSWMSFVPDLNFLTSGWDLRHFHRTIKALSAQDQEKVVHAIIFMGKVLSHTREFFSLRGSQFSEQFAKIHQEFIELQSNFLSQAHSLSTKLDQAGPDTINEVMKGSLITSFTEKLVDFFKKPNLEQRTIEYQLVYYMLNYMDQNHSQIISKTVKHTETNLPRTEREKHLYVFVEQFKFMRAYLKHFPNQNCGEYYSGGYQDLSRFGRMLLDPSFKFHAFKDWINAYVVKLFDHTNWINWFHQDKRKFDPWMGKGSKNLKQQPSVMSCVS